MSKFDSRDIANVIHRILPQEGTRKLCLEMFSEAINYAASCGENKWGVHSEQNIIRLLVGNFIVFTMEKGGVWFALDDQLLDSLEVYQALLIDKNGWKWDENDYPRYSQVQSRNGYYVPQKNHSTIWPVLRSLHFEFTKKAAKKYSQLKKTSQVNHNPAILDYLSSEIGKTMPFPVYQTVKQGDIVQNAPEAKVDKLIEKVREQIPAIQEIEQFKDSYKNLQETTREAVIQSRIGQGDFRAALIKYWQGCSVTNCQKIEILTASHIKPWRSSSNAERLDVFNGLLLLPNLDTCFDSGLISFDDDGKIIISGELDELTLLQLGIKSDLKLLRVEQRHKEYLRFHRGFHRENIFHP
jgi:5-methylcytosine-specific restriction protein A